MRGRMRAILTMAVHPYVLSGLLLSLIVYNSGNYLLAAKNQDLKGIEWERHFGDDRFDHHAQAMAISYTDGSIVIAGTFTLAGRSGEGGQFWLWRVDPKGRKTGEVQLNRRQGGKRLNTAYSYIRAVEILDNDQVLLAIEFTEGQPSIVKVDASGTILFTKPIGKPGVETVIYRILRTTDNHFLLIGRRGADALIVKINASGRMIWRWARRRGLPPRER